MIALRFIRRHLPLVLALAILVVAVMFVPAFRRPGYWLNLAQLYFPAAALALALTPVILTGGIDLSVGSATVLSAVVGGILMRDAGWPPPTALTAAVAVGLAAGLVNGTLVTLGVVPLVATLATRELFRGLAYSVGGTSPVGGLPDGLGDVWRTPLLGLPPPLLVLITLFVVVYVAVHHTAAGRAIFAVGDNEVAARFARVPVRRLKLGLYAACGAVAGVCGAALLLRDESARADAEATLELTAIACVVLGGVRISGGAGHVAGTLLGTVTVCVLLAALTGVRAEGRDLVLGTLLVVVAVANEAARRSPPPRAPDAAAATPSRTPTSA